MASSSSSHFTCQKWFKIEIELYWCIISAHKYMLNEDHLFLCTYQYKSMFYPAVSSCRVLRVKKQMWINRGINSFIEIEGTLFCTPWWSLHTGREITPGQEERLTRKFSWIWLKASLEATAEENENSLIY